MHDKMPQVNPLEVLELSARCVRIVELILIHHLHFSFVMNVILQMLYILGDPFRGQLGLEQGPLPGIQLDQM